MEDRAGEEGESEGRRAGEGARRRGRAPPTCQPREPPRTPAPPWTAGGAGAAVSARGTPVQVRSPLRPAAEAAGRRGGGAESRAQGAGAGVETGNLGGRWRKTVAQREGRSGSG